MAVFSATRNAECADLIRCSDLKGILYPVDVAIAGNGNHVKADRAVCFVGCQVNVRCCDDTGLFGAGDAFSGAAVFIGFAEPDFDDNQCQLVGHY